VTVARGSEQPAPVDRDRQLGEIAQSVRSTFQTIEDMTKFFIREAILRGIYRPGERLNQDAIAEALGVSRMPVRASLRQLEAEGLLSIFPHRGAVVSTLSAAEVAEIFDMRRLLEPYLLEHAIANITDEGIEAVAALTTRIAEAEDPLERHELSKEYYDTLYGFADRPRAAQTAAQLRASVGRYLMIQHLDEHSKHGGLVPFLRERDSKGARTWLVDHLDILSAQMQQLVDTD
jgi:DNA-binding GntR family transcriptional regulator